MTGITTILTHNNGRLKIIRILYTPNNMYVAPSKKHTYSRLKRLLQYCSVLTDINNTCN